MQRLVNLVFAVLFSFFVYGIGDALGQPDPPPPTPPAPTPLTPEQVAALVDENKRLKAEIEAKAKGGEPPTPPTPPKPEDDPLRTKARNEKDEEERTKSNTKKIESALQFNLGIDEFVKTNKELLPEEIGRVVAAGHKETFDTAVSKANALKSSIIQTYFAVQANVDQLTSAQKATLDGYLKLTKNGKEDKAAEIYETIFEPAIETIRKVKKAEEVGRSRAGFASSSSSSAAYKEKLMKGSRASYLGEKEK